MDLQEKEIAESVGVRIQLEEEGGERRRLRTEQVFRLLEEGEKV